MAKIKMKTNAKLNTSRKLDTGTTRSSTRRTTKRKIDVDDVAEEKSGKGGVIAIVIMLILIGGGGAGGYYYYKMQNKAPAKYVETNDELDALKLINNRVNNVQLDVNNLDFLISDINKFRKNFSVEQIVKQGEEELRFTSPNLAPVKKIKDDAVEGLVSSKRVKLRLKDYERMMKEQEDYKNEVQKNLRDAKVVKAKEDQKERLRLEALRIEKQLIADAEALDATKSEVRWEILDSDMFDRSLFKPLEGKFNFDFVNSAKRIDPWVKFKLDAQSKWGKEMRLIVESAGNTFGILSNSGTDHIGWVFIYEKRKGTLRGITKKEFKIKVIDNFEGQEIPKTLTRPIIDIAPDEFWKLLNKAVLHDKLDGSKNAAKKWAALKVLHPDKSEEQILRFGFASLMYCLKQFPSAKKMIGEISEISTDVLSDEIKQVEPTFNRREMNIAMEISNALYSEGKRQDTLMILEKMKERFDFTDEWGEFKTNFDKLFNDADKIKKK